MQLPVALIPRSRPPRHTKEDRGGEKADTREPLRHNGLPCFCPLFPFSVINKDEQNIVKKIFVEEKAEKWTGYRHGADPYLSS